MSEQPEDGRREIRELAAGAQRLAACGQDERHRIRRVRGVRADAVVLEHAFGVAVVGRHQRDAARALDGVENDLQARVEPSPISAPKRSATSNADISGLWS